jgi:hypothetical protein
MNNRLNINEEEKSRIKNLHNITVINEDGILGDVFGGNKDRYRSMGPEDVKLFYEQLLATRKALRTTNVRGASHFVGQMLYTIGKLKI